MDEVTNESNNSERARRKLVVQLFLLFSPFVAMAFILAGGRSAQYWLDGGAEVETNEAAEVVVTADGGEGWDFGAMPCTFYSWDVPDECIEFRARDFADHDIESLCAADAEIKRLHFHATERSPLTANSVHLVCQRFELEEVRLYVGELCTQEVAAILAKEESLIWIYAEWSNFPVASVDALQAALPGCELVSRDEGVIR